MSRLKQRLLLRSFTMPALIFYSLFILYPLVQGLRLSFTNSTGGPSATYVGLAQYRALLHDPAVRESLEHTVVYSLIVVVVQNGIGLVAAAVLSRRQRIQRPISNVLLLPALMSPVMASFIWSYLYQPTSGFNQILGDLGLGALRETWLGNPSTALVAIAVVNIWMFIGYSTLIFLTGYAGIPVDQLEAADVDGASAWQRFRRVEWPMLAPATTVAVTLSLIGTLRVFDFVFVLTDGGPIGSTTTLALSIYNDYFLDFNFGYGAATAVLLLVLVVTVSSVVSSLLRRRELAL